MVAIARVVRPNFLFSGFLAALISVQRGIRLELPGRSGPRNPVALGKSDPLNSVLGGNTCFPAMLGRHWYHFIFTSGQILLEVDFFAFRHQ